VPPNAKRATSGRITWKLKDSVPTSAIAASGTRSCGVCATCRIAERSWPGARRARLPVCSSCGSISHSATSIAPNDSAFSRKHGATPSAAITPPANAGPTIRAEWTIRLFRLTALTTRSRPTISITNA
jgi:hypothetical protein